MTDNIDKYNKGNATVKNGADDQKSDKTDNLENNIEDNERKMVDVIIPTYRPAKEFGELLHRLEKQEYRPNRILVMNIGTVNGRTIHFLKFIILIRKILTTEEPERERQSFRQRILWFL